MAAEVGRVSGDKAVVAECQGPDQHVGDGALRRQALAAGDDMRRPGRLGRTPRLNVPVGGDGNAYFPEKQLLPVRVAEMTNSISVGFSERWDWTGRSNSSRILPRAAMSSSVQLGTNRGVMMGFVLRYPRDSHSLMNFLVSSADRAALSSVSSGGAFRSILTLPI